MAEKFIQNVNASWAIVKNVVVGDPTKSNPYLKHYELFCCVSVGSVDMCKPMKPGEVVLALARCYSRHIVITRKNMLLWLELTATSAK